MKPPIASRHLVAALLLASLSEASWGSDRSVACVGNSITAGYGLPRNRNYPLVLDTLLGDSVAVSNFGVSGRTMVQGAEESYWKESALADALGSRPDVVVIELGTNDAKTGIWSQYGDSFVSDYLRMVSLFLSLPSRPAVWVTLLPRAENLVWNIADSVVALQVNPRILEVARLQGLGVIDLRSGFASHDEWFLRDSIHPNVEGAQAMAGMVARMLQWPRVRVEEDPDSPGTLRPTSPGTDILWYRNDSLLEETSPVLSRPPAGRYRVTVRLGTSSEDRVASEVLNWTNSVGIRRLPPGGSGRANPREGRGDDRSVRIDLRGRSVRASGGQCQAMPVPGRGADGERSWQLWVVPTGVGD